MSPTYSICKNHGYLNGEQTICPICGKPTEVWSRITGYYRPVQNWNEGKAQEYKERKEYDIGHSVLKGKGVLSEKKPDATVVNNALINEEGIMLFTTKTCPNCKIASTWLNNAGIEYDKVDAEENVELTKKFAIMQAPTLVVCSKDGVMTYCNASNIRKYIDSLQKG